MAQIIFLHGASSSGKTTIAKVLQQRAPIPFWHVSIDHLRESGVLPMDRFRSREFDWSSSRPAIFDGFHLSLGAYADAGNNLIVEHILDTAGWAETLQDLFAAHDVLFVGLHCAVEMLSAREQTRGDRTPGSAERDQREIHTGRRYDIEIRSEDGVESNVAPILDAWRSPVRRSEFGA